MSYINKRNEYINVNGLKIAYREINKGKSEKPLVMLVHLAATMDNWDPKFIDLVAEKHHIILLDLPGVGGSEGKEAITHYKVLERFGYVTLVSCRLETGRTHQIRVHLKHIGHTLFNDERYGGDKILKGTTFAKYKQFVENCFSVLPRQALHAKTLGFEHPVTHEFMSFDSELPDDMQACIEKWRSYKLTSNP